MNTFWDHFLGTRNILGHCLTWRTQDVLFLQMSIRMYTVARCSFQAFRRFLGTFRAGNGHLRRFHRRFEPGSRGVLRDGKKDMQRGDERGGTTTLAAETSRHIRTMERPPGTHSFCGKSQRLAAFFQQIYSPDLILEAHPSTRTGI